MSVAEEEVEGATPDAGEERGQLRLGLGELLLRHELVSWREENYVRLVLSSNRESERVTDFDPDGEEAAVDLVQEFQNKLFPFGIESPFTVTEDLWVIPRVVIEALDCLAV